MRAGGYTVHQSLTAEAAAVVKMSLALARRRGHAQVTPLHVAFTLLTSSSPSPAHHQLAFSPPPSYAHGLLRRACVKSHSLQCRALELCFNVALNRLPTTDVGGQHCSPPSSSSSFSASIIHQFNNPTLSNALVAALKRAQANQRRGCIELQSQLPPPPTEQHMQQQQPLVAIKVELDQLVVSILDDPSVSRVMREAGFSSAAVKSNIEEESASMLAHHHHQSASVALVRPQFFNEPHIDFPTNGGFGTSWPAPFLNQAPDGVGSSCKKEDVRAILEAMMRKQGRRRANPVVVGDTASVADASVGELMRRLDRGEVPDELRGAHVLRLHQPRFMARADVDASVSDLRRRSVDATAGVIIYVGDIRWAVDEAEAALAEFSPAKHMAAELARLQAELMAARRGRAWLVAASSYKTYMRCRGSQLEAAWELQPVVVPAGAGNGLALGPRAPPIPAPSMKQGQINRVAEVPVWDHASGEEDGVPALCAECANSYEKESSAVRAKAQDITLALTYFPGWPRADEPQASDKDELLELKSKWSRSCQQMLHLRGDQPPSIPTSASPIPWWCASLPNNQNKPRTEPKPSFAGLSLSLQAPGAVHGTSNSSNQGVKTTLSLLLPDSSEDLNMEPAGQESRAVVCSVEVDSYRLSWYGVSDLPFGNLKREAEGALVPSSGESKRRRHGRGGLDLNLCADEEENTGDSEEDHPVPSNLTQECESYGEAGHHTSSDESHE